MKTSMSANLESHMQQTVMTLTYLAIITRTDGTVMRFTTLDSDLDLGGHTYISSYGFTPTGLHSQQGLAVDNMDLMSILNDSYVNPSDILAGLYDNARIELHRCNFRSTADGVEILKVGFAGEISFGDISFKMELRGLAQALQQMIGEVSQPACRADVYDSRCGLVKATYTNSGEVTAVTDKANFEDNTTAAILAVADGKYNFGEVEWTSGNNNGKVMEIKLHQLSGGVAYFELFLPMQDTIQVGDTFDVSLGCDKTLATCRDDFNNVDNHRGDPFNRTQDFLTTWPEAKK